MPDALSILLSWTAWEIPLEICEHGKANFRLVRALLLTRVLWGAIIVRRKIAEGCS